MYCKKKKVASSPQYDIALCIFDKIKHNFIIPPNTVGKSPPPSQDIKLHKCPCNIFQISSQVPILQILQNIT